MAKLITKTYIKHIGHINHNAYTCHITKYTISKVPKQWLDSVMRSLITSNPSKL
ncbi:hypothetical protein F383_29787 [Gossypium arboreum]|uniref:Uncharacterized protein n=1 Tax=Gossypium arboreum TaxID=29729 RepID=A0A0B0N0E6_GOSAR|nr:hypothetical protein F383_29787 [Gossypium arboreum]